MTTQILPPTVCLDGDSVRRIREQKQLTQLYVAKVVGVTTDTISRWENNRYPSIKRENALRLADALETAVADILRADTEEAPAPAPATADAPAANRPSLGLILLIVVVLAVSVWFFGWQQQGALHPMEVQAERLLPGFAAPGSVVPVRVRVRSQEETKGFILREHFPAGWKLLEANPPASSLDNEKGIARWIIKPGDHRPLISYLVKVAPDAQEGQIEAFFGEVVATGTEIPGPVVGESQLPVGPFQWADLDGDNLIDDSEMLKASDTVDEMQGVHLDWQLLEDIWDAGGYRWDSRRRTFIPVKPAPAEVY